MKGNDANSGTRLSPLRTIQAAVDRGGDVKVHSGSYEPFTARKAVTVEPYRSAKVDVQGTSVMGSAIVTVQADDVTVNELSLHDGAGYGLLTHNARTTLSGCGFLNLACAAEFRGTDGTVEDFTVENMTKAVTNDWGGTAFNEYAAKNTIIRRGTAKNLRTPLGVVPNYPSGDGGFNACYAGADGVLIEDVEVWDSININEDGHQPTQPNNANFTFRRLKVHGSPDKVLDHWWDDQANLQKVCMGLIFRATVNVLVEDCDFIDMDGWMFRFDHSGNHYGSVTNANLTGNRFQLKAGDNRAYLINAGIDPKQLTFGNTVTQAPGNQYVAYNEVLKGNTSDLNVFKSWGVNVGAETWA